MEEKDCIAFTDAKNALAVHRVTLYKLLRRLNIPTYKFPGKRKTYLAKTDFAKLRQGQISKPPDSDALRTPRAKG